MMPSTTQHDAADHAPENEYQNVRMSQRKCEATHVPRASSRFT